MATVCNLFFVTFGLSILVARVSYGHKLLDISSRKDLDEKASCPNVNCDGERYCSSPSQCPSNQCCDDLQTSMKCCYTPGDPTRPPVTQPATAAPTPAPTATPTPAPTPAHTISTCSGLTIPCPIPTDGSVNECKCSSASDCYENEICCIDLAVTTVPGGGLSPLCHTTDPQVTTLAPGLPCPASVSTSPCQRPGVTGAPNAFCDLQDASAPKCSNGQICCKRDRYSSACCIKYP